LTRSTFAPLLLTVLLPACGTPSNKSSPETPTETPSAVLGSRPTTGTNQKPTLNSSPTTIPEGPIVSDTQPETKSAGSDAVISESCEGLGDFYVKVDTVLKPEGNCTSRTFSTISVEPGISLTVTAGMSLTPQSETSKMSVGEGAKLNLMGTSERPVTIDIRRSQMWTGIALGSRAHLTMRYTSIGGAKEALIAGGESQVDIAYSQFINNKSGIFCGLCTIVGLNESSFIQNDIPLIVSAFKIKDIGNGLKFLSNGKDGLTLYPFYISKFMTVKFKNLGFPYFVRGPIRVLGNLIVEAGVELKMAEQTRIVVEDDATFESNGTSSSRVTFSADVASAGWSGIYLANKLSRMTSSDILGVTSPSQNSAVASLNVGISPTYIWPFATEADLTDLRIVSTTAPGVAVGQAAVFKTLKDVSIDSGTNPEVLSHALIPTSVLDMLRSIIPLDGTLSFAPYIFNANR